MHPTISRSPTATGGTPAARPAAGTPVSRAAQSWADDILATPHGRADKLNSLVQVACRNDTAGEQAREGLRNIYERADEPTRREVRELALAMCTVALKSPEPQLSLTVAFFGGLCEWPPGGEPSQRAIQGHIADSFGAARGSPEHDTWAAMALDTGRPPADAEVLGAAASFAQLAVPAEVADLSGESGARLVADAVARAESTFLPQALWVDGGKEGPAPLVIGMRGGVPHYHVLAAADDHGAQLRGQLGKLDLAANQVHTHAVKDSPGVAGQRLLQAMDAALGDPASPLSKTGDVGTFVGEQLAQWDALSPEDDAAAQLSTRAAMLEAGRAWKPPVAHFLPLGGGPGPGLVVAAPVIMAAPPVVMATPPVVMAERVPAAAAPRALSPRLQEVLTFMDFANRPARKGQDIPRFSSFAALSTSINQMVAESDPDLTRAKRDVRHDLARDEFASIPNRELKELAEAANQLHRLTQALRLSNSAVVTNGQLLNPEVDAKIQALFMDLGGAAAAAQLPTRFGLLLNAIAQAAVKTGSGDPKVAVQAKNTLNLLRKEVGDLVKKEALIKKLIDELDGLLQAEEELKGPARWMAQFRGYSAATKAGRADIQKLRDGLAQFHSVLTGVPIVEVGQPPEPVRDTAWKRMRDFAELGDSEADALAAAIRESMAKPTPSAPKLSPSAPAT